MNAAFRFTSQANGTFTERAARADHRESDERRIWGTEATESSFEDVIQPQEKLKPEDVYRSQRSAFVKHSPAKPNRPSRADLHAHARGRSSIRLDLLVLILGE
jgi:hypothetical protein